MDGDALGDRSFTGIVHLYTQSCARPSVAHAREAPCAPSAARDAASRRGVGVVEL